MIVTENFRDIPVTLIPSAIELRSPAEFAYNTVAINPAAARRAVGQMAERFRNPPQSIDQVLDDLISRYGFADAVEMIREV